MATTRQTRGGRTAWNDGFIGAARQITVDTEANRLRLHDGVTQGGFPLARLDDQFGYSRIEKVLADANAKVNADSLRLTRDANYTGGTKGHVYSALFLDTTVRDGTLNFEWGLTSRVNNYSNGDTENVGMYGQINQYGTGGSWGGVWEMCDHRNRPTQAGDGLSWGGEIDCWTSHSDPLDRRKGLSVVVGHRDEVRGGVLNPPNKAIAYCGIMVEPYGGNRQNAQFKNGVIVWSALQTAYLANIGGQRAFQAQGEWGLGLDTSSAAISSGTAIRMGLGQAISFDADDIRKLRVEGGALQYTVNGAQRLAVTDTGELRTSAIALNGLRTNISGEFGSGTAAAPLANNKPGAAAAGPATWLKVTIDNTTMWIPAWPN